MRSRLGRPSPALVISVVALFVAMGGTGYAAAKFTGKNIKDSSLTGSDIKNSSIGGADVKNNSLTGSDVLESKLGKVPTAGKADSAATAGQAGSAATANTANSANTAGNANTVGGNRVVTFSTTGTATLFSLGGITLTCDAGTNAVSATASTAGRIDVVGLDTISDNDTDNRTFNATIAAGGTRKIVGGAGTPPDEPDSTSQLMQLTWSTSAGNVVTANFRVNACATAGSAVGG